MLAKHSPDPNRPTGSDGSTSCMSEFAMPDDENDPAAGIRRRGVEGHFSTITDRSPASGRASEIVSPERAAALWRTLEDSGISTTRPPTETEEDE